MNRLTDLEAVLSPVEATIRTVLERINRSVHLFQIIVDGDGRLCGTVTDGDVRRAILRGATLDDPVTHCMNDSPRTGRTDAPAENLALLRSLDGLRVFLPVLDAEGRVSEVLVGSGGEPPGFAALVMAGGRGARLGEHTRDTPKPLLPVGERPILDRVLERLEGAGARRIYVAVHYLAERIEAFLGERRCAVPVEIVREDSPLGTAGAIGRLPHLDGPLLVLNGDVLTTVDIPAFAGFHHRHEYDATIAVAQHETRIPFGVVRHAEDGSFLGIEEKPATTHFVAAGMYYLSPDFAALVPADRPMDMPELLNLGRRIGLRIGLFPIHEYWRDVGRPEDLAAANRDHGEEG